MLLIVDSDEDVVSVLDMDDLVLERVTRDDINNAIQHGVVFENIDCDIVCRHPDAKIAISPFSLMVESDSGVQSIGVQRSYVFDKLWRMPPFVDTENDFGLKMSYVGPYELRLRMFIQGSIYDIDMVYMSSGTCDVYINSQYMLSLEYGYSNFREYGFIGYLKQDHVLILSLYEVSFILSKSNLYLCNSSGGYWGKVYGIMKYEDEEYTIGDFKRMLLLD